MLPCFFPMSVFCFGAAWCSTIKLLPWLSVAGNTHEASLYLATRVWRKLCRTWKWDFLSVWSKYKRNHSSVQHRRTGTVQHFADAFMFGYSFYPVCSLYPFVWSNQEHVPFTPRLLQESPPLIGPHVSEWIIAASTAVCFLCFTAFLDHLFSLPWTSS